jgi:diguanylate cyclase (GGDEF)-like protein/PAS domain S-box-containing protein
MVTILTSERRIRHPEPSWPGGANFLDAVLAASTDAIFVHARDGSYLYANQTALAILGRSLDEVVGRTPEELIPTIGHKIVKEVHGVIASAVPLTASVTYERAEALEGEFEYTISPVRGDDRESGGAVVIAREVTERRRSEAMIRHLAFFDRLTDLPNRTALEKDLAARIKSSAGGKLAAFLLDLDRFKNINDTLSHAVGDQVLLEISTRLRTCAQETSGTVGRMSGDKFMLIIPGVDGAQAQRLCRRLLAAFGAPVVLDERPGIAETQRFSVTASVGVAIHPHSGQDGPTLIRNAEIALYEAKAQGRNTFRVHTQRLGLRAAHRLALENELVHAVERKQFTVYYQPIVTSSDGTIGHAEALLRWEHPEFGLIGPTDFIHLAEENGTIFAIGNWLVEAVTEQIREWIDAGLPALKVAINLSPRQLNQLGLVETLGRALRDHDLTARQLEVEVTESTAIREIDRTVARLRELRRMGIRTVIDDFGSGYAALSYLKRLPIDTIKIDKIFVQECTAVPQDAAIVKAIIDLAHNLKLRTVAEGVEKPAQCEMLRSLGCDSMQGYLFSRPLPATQFAELIRRNERYLDRRP